MRVAVFVGVLGVPLLGMPVANAVPPIVVASLVQTINTAAFSPGSPDPAGITYRAGPDRLVIADSEVDETTGAGFHDANIWTINRVGGQFGTGNTISYTTEPTGLGFDPATGRMFISSDSGEKVFIITPGNDGLYATPDDPRITLLMANHGSVDTEDVAFNTANGHMYVADGSAVEVIDLDPVDGIFGNGNDVATHFDVAVHGAKDTEGLAYDAIRDTLVVADISTQMLYEVTVSGALVRTIDMRTIAGMSNPADVEIAPASNGSGQRNYWVVDREVDNGTNSSENDGRLFEVAVPTGSDAVPTVTLTAPAEGATVAGSSVPLAATPVDDNPIAKVEWFRDTTSNLIATDTSSTGGWTGSWNTIGVSEGAHTIIARVTDSIGQTGSDTNAVTVDNIDAPPTITLTAPAEGASIAGGSVVPLAATAADDRAGARVDWFLDTTANLIATDTSSSGGWTGSWNTTGVSAGGHTIIARITDSGLQTASDSNGVTVTYPDEPPTVTLVSPAQDAVVAGVSVALSATADDDNGVTKVEWFLDAGTTPIATDSNGGDGYAKTWDPTSAADGPHTITARATDSASQTANDTHDIEVDNIDEAPSVTLVSPAAGALVAGGSVPLSATASDDRGVVQVEFLLDGVTSLGIDTNGSDGWTGTWNTTGLEGAHTVSAVATDTANQQAASQHAVTVDNTAPAVSITSPTQDSQVIGSVNVIADVTDAGVVTSVQFFRDGISIGTDTSSAGGWSVSWNSASTTNGPHDLTARATDQAGNQATSQAVGVTVANPLVLNIPIAAGSDDAEEKPNLNTVLNSADLDMMTDNSVTFTAVGLRFAQVNLPVGATVTSAYVQFTSDEAWNVSSNLRIVGQETLNPATFTTAKSSITGRLAARTDAEAAWSSTGWTVKNVRTAAQQTPDLSGVLNEIIGQQGWATGNAVVFLITGNPSGRLVADTFEAGGGNIPTLHIEYETT